MPCSEYTPATAVGTRSKCARQPLRFETPTSAHIAAVRQVLDQYTLTRTCDFSVGGIFMWADWFGYSLCMPGDETLLIGGRAEGVPGDVKAFSLPVCRDIPAAVHAIIGHCRRYRIRPVFSAVPEDFVAAVMRGAGMRGDVTELTDWADYLYDIDDIAYLRGKRFNKKRNHVNRFVADNPHYSVEPIDNSLIPETLLFCAGRRHDHDGSKMAVYEHGQCMRVLNEWPAFGFDGLVLRAESGEIAAFSAAEVIGDTAFVHIEKCNHEIAGANEAMASFMAKYLANKYSRLRYLNREEDVGDDGLRLAKQSWQPVQMLRKYNIFF